MFSNVEYAEISSQLDERFGSLRLDKYDYAFATFSGIIGGIVDAVFVGTIGKDSSGSKLRKGADELMNKVVQVYAKLNGWNGSRGDTVDSMKSATEFLERKSRVSFDTRYGKDIQLSKVDSAGLNPSNHHLRSLAHSPAVLGLLIGIFDVISKEKLVNK